VGAVVTLDERAAEQRRRMVERIRERYCDDERVLDAVGRIPRHRFLPDVDDLDVVHDVDRAVAVPGSYPGITTSVSAPGLVAWMLELLDLEPGMRVLEIGAGSGYNAALLATLVGDPALVTTVDIDAALIEPARARLAELGLGAVRVVEGDGDLGVPDAAPFDRVIVTVGSNDLAPSWFDQLAPGGFLLVPLHHGPCHPVVRATESGSRVVGRSGFVRMLGRQDQLPEWKVPMLDSWDATYFVALHVLPGDEADPRRIRELVDRWRAMGEPPMERFRSTWVARGTGSGAWVLPRIHHDQVVELD
jgi:protein-L-isoaspartate(D-aspartate) O-methyltransferase